MIDPCELRDWIIVPTLQRVNAYSIGAVQLMLGTAMQESECGTFLRQIGGPALGLWQMEPATHDDLARTSTYAAWELDPYPERRLRPATDMIGDLYYACAMARLLYWRVPAPLPAANDFDGQAAYYKLHYNTPAGAATVAQYLAGLSVLREHGAL